MLSALGSLTTTAILAQVTPPAPIQVNSPIITINSSPGDQTDPHVDKDLVSYTDAATNQIRYYRFSTGVDLAIPQDQTTLFDVLSDVNGGRIAFSRVEMDRNAIYVFDTSTLSLTEIDPHAGSNRFNPALGGNTLAFVDQSSGNGDIFSYDLGANPPKPPLVVSLDPNAEQNPNVSPDGRWIVWEDCAVSITHCNVFKGILSGGVWSVSAVENSPDPEGNPDTDGIWIVYDANRAGNATGQDIYYQPVGGGAEVQLSLPGDQQNPSIKGGFIGFESRATSSSPADLFVYDIANNILYQVTATPTIDENLSDISLLDNGDIRMVWAANDGAAGDENIHATTFTPIRPALYQICPLYDSNVAKKAGSAYPIKIQLCDASGTNLSSSSIMLHAVSVVRTSTNTPTVFDDTGDANPDFDFRYDSSLGGYVFNLSTKGYATGTYSLNFSAGTDPAPHSALFAVK
jgi:Tol biopolymer transport system component